ncbi:MAG TPA: PIN domain-containing protein [Bryobacteraceae bacterium]|jgi:predicted nucleic acid-binding protein|nr:PIN domain-containing protein [Bryobacteraceae bacterium]
MALIADSGGIYALYDRRDTHYARVRAAVEQEKDEIIIPSVVLTEIDHLLRMRVGNRAMLQVLADIDKGAFQIEAVTPDDLRRCGALIRLYAHLDLDLCDAAVVAAAERLGTKRILTVDERDFRVIRSLAGESFILLPADLSKGKRRG